MVCIIWKARPFGEFYKRKVLWIGDNTSSFSAKVKRSAVKDTKEDHLQSNPLFNNPWHYSSRSQGGENVAAASFLPCLTVLLNNAPAPLKLTAKYQWRLELQLLKQTGVPPSLTAGERNDNRGARQDNMAVPNQMVFIRIVWIEGKANKGKRTLLGFFFGLSHAFRCHPRVPAKQQW